MAPAESVSIDYANYNNQDIMVIKDRSSGFIGAVLTKDQSTDESVRAMMTWFHSYGFCHVLRSDGGGSFRASFTKKMEDLGVEHRLSSPYNSSSNGAAERTVRHIKSFLRKENIERVSQELLNKICFKVNNHVQDELTGSPAERFLRRKPKTLLPNSIERDVDWKSMLTERTNKTTKHVESTKERKSRDEFKIGDRVILQEQTGRKQWIDKGTIDTIRPSDDNSCQSFTIALDRGGICVRNKRFIKHLRNTVTDAKENDASDPPDGPFRNTRRRTRSE